MAKRILSHPISAGATLTSTPVSAGTGLTALTMPFWGTFVQSGHQAILAVLGLVVLVLTIRGKLLDNKIKRLKLQALKDGDGGEE